MDTRSGRDSVCPCARRAVDWIINEHLGRLNSVLEQIGYELCFVNIDYRPLSGSEESEDWAPELGDDEPRH